MGYILISYDHTSILFNHPNSPRRSAAPGRAAAAAAGSAGGRGARKARLGGERGDDGVEDAARWWRGPGKMGKIMGKWWKTAGKMMEVDGN